MTDKILEDCNKDIPEFSLCGLTLKGKVVEVYDGDTCKIVLPLQNSLYKFTCRLNGIDSPEIKPKKDKPNRDNEILLAKKARNELLKLIIPNNSLFDNIDIKKEDICIELEKNKKLVIVKCLEFDKYGRLLVELYSNTDSIDSADSFNSILLSKNLSVSYDGGKKINPWTKS
jgi:endonuclease YncB( thermonuclease family)